MISRKKANRSQGTPYSHLTYFHVTWWERVNSPVGMGKTMLKSQWDRSQYG